MTDTEINMAIAEECGWQWYRMPFKFGDTRKYRCLFLPAVHEYEGQSPSWLVHADMTEAICNWEYMRKEGLVRDYVIDLNGMHEAEAMLVDNEPAIFARIIRQMLGPHTHSYYDMIHATAHQRAEAFLKTKGKFVEKSQ